MPILKVSIPEISGKLGMFHEATNFNGQNLYGTNIKKGSIPKRTPFALVFPVRELPSERELYGI